jgi:NAD(P)-dependent dehydrogenase (short-subunit alcohol dehydrogenase family)
MVDAAKPLAGVTAMVTGASSGLGAAFARALAGAGAKVALAARRKARLDALAAELGEGACAVQMDVAEPAAIAAAFDEAEATLGPIDALINNAGMNAEGAALDLTPDAFDRVIAVNLRGPFLCAQAFARRAISAGRGGRIVNVASIGALRPLPGLAAYCASKAGLAMLTKALALEWARKEISVNAICPGYIETDLNADWLNSEGGAKMISKFPRRRLLVAEDLIPLLIFLAGPQSARVTGSVFTIDDGQSL